VKIAEKFRADELSSNDKDDDTVVAEDWTQHRAVRRARGGPYMAVHLRYWYHQRDEEYKKRSYLRGFCQVSDPHPNWFRILSGQWIRIRIWNPDPYPDPGGQK
jgi:hypothetical protein